MTSEDRRLIVETLGEMRELKGEMKKEKNEERKGKRGSGLFGEWRMLVAIGHLGRKGRGRLFFLLFSLFTFNFTGGNND